MPSEENSTEQGSSLNLPGESANSSAADQDGIPVTEDEALALLSGNDVSPEALERLSRSAAIKSRKVKLALVEHPRTPRHVSIPIVRHLYTFDLVRVALAPPTPADVKFAAEETLINRLESIPAGEKLTLARSASGRVAGELLFDHERRIVLTALDNSRLTEAAVFKALMRADASATLVQAVCHHSKWSLRREVRIALLRNAHTPPACALEFVRSLPAALVKEVLPHSRLPANLKAHLLQELERRRPDGRASRAAQS